LAEGLRLTLQVEAVVRWIFRSRLLSLSEGVHRRRHSVVNAAGTAKAVAAAKAEAKIVELVRSTPGMRTSAIARATASGLSSVAGRLKRLQSRGQVERDASEGWRAAEGLRPNEAKTNPAG
jgi:hypothetical protein